MRPWWFLLPIIVLIGLGAACLYFAAVPPQGVTGIVRFLLQQARTPPAEALAIESQCRAGFSTTYVGYGLLCGLAVAAWAVLWFSKKTPQWFMPLLGGCMILELLCFGFQQTEQSDPALYYPPIPAIWRKVAGPNRGRILGFMCLPAAALDRATKLARLRGYDAVDPARLIDLTAQAADPTLTQVPYARHNG